MISLSDFCTVPPVRVASLGVGTPQGSPSRGIATGWTWTATWRSAVRPPGDQLSVSEEVRVRLRGGWHVRCQLRHAIDARRYSSPVRESAGYFRIGGDVSSSVVALTFKPYFMPGLRAGYGAMTLELHGEIHATAEGSEIRANVFAPVRRPMVWALAILLVVSIAVSVAGSGDAFGWAFGVGGGSLVSAVWVRILRHNQRMALRNTDEFTRLVGSIVSTEPPVV